jgi:hypothetical protein
MRREKKKKIPGKYTQLSFYSINICAQHDDERRLVYYAWQTDSKITEKSLMRTFFFMLFDLFDI